MAFETLSRLIGWSPTPTTQFIGSDILLKETKLCLFAAPKMFKSILAQQLGFCIAGGVPWLGFPITQGKVAYLQCEIPKAPFRDRVLKMSSNITTPSSMYHFETDLSFKLERKTDRDTLYGFLAKEQPDILILDPWYKIMYEEGPSSYGRTQDIMDDIISRFRVTLVVVHHDTVPMADPRTGQQIHRFHPRGPRTVEGWFDSMIQIGGDIFTDKRTLRFELRHGQQLLQPMDIYMDRNVLWASRI